MASKRNCVVPCGALNPLSDALSLPRCFIARNGRTFKHGLEFRPTSPQNQPTGGVIMLAVLMTTQSGQGIVKIMHRPGRPFLFMAPPRQQPHPRPGQYRDCGLALGFRPTTQVTQLQQRQGYDRQQGDDRFQPVAVAELQLLDVTAGLLSLVVLLDYPAEPIPGHAAAKRQRRSAPARWSTRSIPAARPQPGDRSRPRATHTCKGTPRSSPRGWRGGSSVTNVQATPSRTVRAD